MAYRFYCLRESTKTGDKTIERLSTQQCYYYDKYCSNVSKFNDHVKYCSDIAGNVYKFEHKNIVSFQDNFGYLGGLLFVVYFDYETTADDNVFNDKKKFVISYCQIHAFHPDLNLNKIVIFQSFQQTEYDIYDLNHFSEEHVKYFDLKSTSLSEMCNLQLKVIHKLKQGM